MGGIRTVAQFGGGSSVCWIVLTSQADLLEVDLHSLFRFGELIRFENSLQEGFFVLPDT